MENKIYHAAKLKFIHEQVQNGLDAELICRDIGVNTTDYIQWLGSCQLEGVKEKNQEIEVPSTLYSMEKTNSNFQFQLSRKGIRDIPSSSSNADEKEFLNQIAALIVEIALRDSQASMADDILLDQK